MTLAAVKHRSWLKLAADDLKPIKRDVMILSQKKVRTWKNFGNVIYGNAENMEALLQEQNDSETEKLIIFYDDTLLLFSQYFFFSLSLTHSVKLDDVLEVLPRKGWSSWLPKIAKCSYIVPSKTTTT